MKYIIGIGSHYNVIFYIIINLYNTNIINTNYIIYHHAKINNFCHIAPNVAICGNVSLYDGVFLAVGTSIVPKIKVRPWQFIKANSLVKESTAPVAMYEPYKTES